MKMHRLIAPFLVFAACANAGAAVQLVSLPNLPLSLPTRIAPESVSLPTRIAPEAVSLPSSPMIPMGPSLPVVPSPMPTIAPGVRLPGPRLIPTMPKRLAVTGVDERQPAPKRDERLEQIFDGSGSRRPLPITEDRYHTIPEQDLVNEIGTGYF